MGPASASNSYNENPGSPLSGIETVEKSFSPSLRVKSLVEINTLSSEASNTTFWISPTKGEPLFSVITLDGDEISINE